MFLPGEVVRGTFKRPAHNYAVGEKGLTLRKIVQHDFKPGSKLHGLLPAFNEISDKQFLKYLYPTGFTQILK